MIQQKKFKYFSFHFLLPQSANSPFIQAPTTVYLPEQIPERPAKLPLCPFAPKPSPIPNKEPEPQTVKPSSTPYNPHVTLPVCEHYFRERGYDFKISNGRVVVYKPEKRKRRRRRQGQVKLEMTDKQTVQVIMLQNWIWLSYLVVPMQRTIPFEPGSSLQIILRERVSDQSVTWTGPGFVRVQDGEGLRFTVSNIPAALDHYVVIRYEPEVIQSFQSIFEYQRLFEMFWSISHLCILNFIFAVHQWLDSYCEHCPTWIRGWTLSEWPIRQSVYSFRLWKVRRFLLGLFLNVYNRYIIRFLSTDSLLRLYFTQKFVYLHIVYLPSQRPRHMKFLLL